MFKNMDLVDSWIKMLKNDELSPDRVIKNKDGLGVSILEAVLDMDIGYVFLLKKIKVLVGLGCNVDFSPTGSSPLEMALIKDVDLAVIKFMLDKHESSKKDVNVLQAALKSSNSVELFKLCLQHKNIDPYSIKNSGSNILHYMSEEDHFANYIKILFDLIPDFDVNSINNVGMSALSVAVSKINYPAIEILKNIKSAKLLGDMVYIGSPMTLIDCDIVDRYDGDFWKDYPEFIDYALSKEKAYLIPEINELFYF